MVLRLLRAIGIVLPSILGLRCVAQSWVQLASLPGGPRQAPSSFVIDGKAYVVGGWDFSTFFNELWMYDPLLDSWTQKANMPGPGRQTAVAFAIDGIGYFGTGYNNDELNDWYAYDPGTDTWTEREPLPGNGRKGAVGWALNGRGYVATGDAPNYTNDVFEYDPVLDQWAQLDDFPGLPRRYAVGFTLGSHGYLCTGQGTNGHGNTCWRFDPGDGSWEQVANYPLGCSGGMAVTLNGRAQMFVGYYGSYQSTIHEYDPVDDAWTELEPFTGGIRAYATTFMIDGEGYLGMGFGTVMQSDLWKVGGIPTGTAQSVEAATPWIHPTIGNGEIMVYGNIKGSSALYVLDALDRLVFRTAITQERTTLRLSLDAGTYVVLLAGEEGRKNARLVIE